MSAPIQTWIGPVYLAEPQPYIVTYDGREYDFPTYTAAAQAAWWKVGDAGGEAFIHRRDGSCLTDDPQFRAMHPTLCRRPAQPDPELIRELFHRATHLSGYTESTAWYQIATMTTQQWADYQAMLTYANQVDAARSFLGRSK